MPTYAYKCFECEQEFEVFQKITDAPIAKCEHCGSSNVKRMLFATPFQLKGTGWYKTDYASSSSSSSGSNHGKNRSETKSESPSASVEKAATKTDGTKEASKDTSKSPTTSHAAAQ